MSRHNSNTNRYVHILTGLNIMSTLWLLHYFAIGQGVVSIAIAALFILAGAATATMVMVSLAFD